MPLQPKPQCAELVCLWQVGHEVAHAVARHSSEKLSLGIFVTVASQLAFQVFQVYIRRKQGPTQGRGLGGGAQGIPVAWYLSSAS